MPVVLGLSGCQLASGGAAGAAAAGAARPCSGRSGSSAWPMVKHDVRRVMYVPRSRVRPMACAAATGSAGPIPP